MKILCTAAVFLLLSGQTIRAQQNLSTLKVSFETGKTTADEAVKRFLNENIAEYAYSSDDLKAYSVQPTKCHKEPVLSCLNKLLKDVPVETMIFKNSVIIRPLKKRKTSFLPEPTTQIIAKTDTAKAVYNTKIMDELVLNAGYYKVSERERTGSISKVTAKDIENQPVTNVLSAAQGRMAGVNITQNGGTAGGGFQVDPRKKQLTNGRQ